MQDSYCGQLWRTVARVRTRPLSKPSWAKGYPMWWVWSPQKGFGPLPRLCTRRRRPRRSEAGKGQRPPGSGIPSDATFGTATPRRGGRPNWCTAPMGLSTPSGAWPWLRTLRDSRLKVLGMWRRTYRPRTRGKRGILRWSLLTWLSLCGCMDYGAGSSKGISRAKPSWGGPRRWCVLTWHCAVTGC